MQLSCTLIIQYRILHRFDRKACIFIGKLIGEYKNPIMVKDITRSSAFNKRNAISIEIWSNSRRKLILLIWGLLGDKIFSAHFQYSQVSRSCGRSRGPGSRGKQPVGLSCRSWAAWLSRCWGSWGSLGSAETYRRKIAIKRFFFPWKYFWKVWFFFIHLIACACHVRITLINNRIHISTMIEYINDRWSSTA